MNVETYAETFDRRGDVIVTRHDDGTESYRWTDPKADWCAVSRPLLDDLLARVGYIEEQS